MTVRETVDARTSKFGPAELEELFEGATRILVAKGKRTVTVDLAKDELEPGALDALVLGRSGNLRAPSARMGKTWIVGYGEETWTGHFD